MKQCKGNVTEIILPGTSLLLLSRWTFAIVSNELSFLCPWVVLKNDHPQWRSRSTGQAWLFFRSHHPTSRKGRNALFLLTPRLRHLRSTAQKLHKATINHLWLQVLAGGPLCSSRVHYLVCGDRYSAGRSGTHSSFNQRISWCYCYPQKSKDKGDKWPLGPPTGSIWTVNDLNPPPPLQLAGSESMMIGENATCNKWSVLSQNASSSLFTATYVWPSSVVFCK